MTLTKPRAKERNSTEMEDLGDTCGGGFFFSCKPLLAATTHYKCGSCGWEQHSCSLTARLWGGGSSKRSVSRVNLWLKMANSEEGTHCTSPVSMHSFHSYCSNNLKSGQLNRVALLHLPQLAFAKYGADNSWWLLITTIGIRF